MKPAVLEVMRMNRVCRMVLVTSVGSFILVIFYFQIMRRNPFGMDICCQKGSRSPLQELYNPTQVLKSLKRIPRQKLRQCVDMDWQGGVRECDVIYMRQGVQ
uniref:Carbohydrate sulfotransferase 11 n=1 Tax=Geospiza parvula TaxID=87175 RepID=A0A8C3MZ40_GEOPR